LATPGKASPLRTSRTNVAGALLQPGPGLVTGERVVVVAAGCFVAPVVVERPVVAQEVPVVVPAVVLWSAERRAV